MKLSKWKLRKRLASLGTSVDVTFLCYVNNCDPIRFDRIQDCYDYLKRIRQECEISKLAIYRIETYSL